MSSTFRRVAMDLTPLNGVSGRKRSMRFGFAALFGLATS